MSYVSDPSTGATSKFADVPVQGLTPTQVTAGAAISPANLVTITGVQSEYPTTFTATSDDPSLATPVVAADGTLTFKYGTIGAGGSATITVTASNRYDQTSASTSFLLTVPPASSTATGPVTTAFTANNVVTGVADTFQPLTNDTDATAGLNPAAATPTGAPSTTTSTSGASITTYPTAAGGTVSVDATDGRMTYTSAAGFTGTDTFQYTVADANGTVSAPTTVTLNVVPTPLTATVGGTSKIQQLLFTQPDGARGRLTVTGGSAVVTFSAGSNVTQPTIVGGTETVTGAGTTIANVVVTNRASAASVTVTKIGGTGTVTVGGLSDSGMVSSLNLPSATLEGTVSLGGLVQLTVASLDHASVSIGTLSPLTTAVVATAVDSSLAVTNDLRSLTSRSWTVDDGGQQVVSAAAVGTLNVTGLFADVLDVTSSTGYVITSATVGGASAPWVAQGAIFKATVTSPTADWSLQAGSLIQTLTVRGDLLSAVNAATINDVTVTGAITNGSIETSGLFAQKAIQLRSLTVGGAITGSIVYTAGNIGSISAASVSSSRIYAGASTAVAQASGLPAGTTDLTSEATISSFNLRGAKATFAGSEVAAYKLLAVHLGAVTASNSGTPFGLSAHTFGAVSAVLNPGGVLNLSAADLKSAATLSALIAKRKLSLSDFTIKVY